MKSFTSLSSVQQQNTQKLLETIRVLDPELYQFFVTSLETGISPLICTKLLREIENIANGSKWGKVSLYIADGIINELIGERKTKLHEPIDTSEGLFIETASHFEFKIEEK